ncbi:DUF262 domain-containing protein [Mucilaginibacter sp.]|uniref:DUF262 domain-containing protein n=1 Tax=Mucilaginibacter sp. TaxID=1882438 RepID=UPI0035BBBADA
MKNSVDSCLLAVGDIMKSPAIYNIPRYQRLYVWNHEQVNILLTDILQACNDDKNLFYLGGVLIVQKSVPEHKYDLIDGQQRFTTLWLISLILGGDLRDFATHRHQSRLTFAIRKKVKAYFDACLNGEVLAHEMDEPNDDGSLARIVEAQTLIKTFVGKYFAKDDRRKSKFRNFIIKNVKMLVTTVPDTPHLNKLFEVINNRGMQLQHHEILKAYLLEKIRSNKKLRISYGKLWDACSDMNEYLERTLRAEAGQSVAKHYTEWSGKFDLDTILEMLGGQVISVKPQRLSDIMDNYKVKDADTGRSDEFEEHPESADDQYEPVRSILSFPQLLQHTLRIYLKQRNKEDIKRINEKELLLSFEQVLKEMNERDVKAFLWLLFEVRMCFDNHIIKWVTLKPNEEVHLIKHLKRKNRDYNSKTHFLLREKTASNEGFALLQSMLYHTQQITTHYWLTPLLMEMLKTNNQGTHYQYLRKLDNYLYSTGRKDEDSGIRTWKLMDRPIDLPVIGFHRDLLMGTNGTGFAHYWFYKLEYVLWFLKRQEHSDWSNFRLTAKNSVEHVSPQTRLSQDFQFVTEEYLDTFGNLALVTRSINSEFGNKEFNVKRKQFLNKKQEGKLESLKLDIMYRSGRWNDDMCIAHRREMIDLLEQYLTMSI